MLRRSHARHRGLRARYIASASADSSNDCRQARHLMTASLSRKSGHRARRLSTGHGRARSNVQIASQIVRQFIMPNAIRRPFPSASPSANLLGRLDADHKSLSRLSNRHSACGTALSSPKRGFLPWRLSDAGRRTRGAVNHAAGIRNPSQQRTSGDRIPSPSHAVEYFWPEPRYLHPNTPSAFALDSRRDIK
jgi:hypothetical protein